MALENRVIEAYRWWLALGWDGRLLVFVLLTIVIVVTTLAIDAWKERRGRP